MLLLSQYHFSLEPAAKSNTMHTQWCEPISMSLADWVSAHAVGGLSLSNWIVIGIQDKLYPPNIYISGYMFNTS